MNLQQFSANNETLCAWSRCWLVHWLICGHIINFSPLHTRVKNRDSFFPQKFSHENVWLQNYNPKNHIIEWKLLLSLKFRRLYVLSELWLVLSSFEHLRFIKLIESKEMLQFPLLRHSFLRTSETFEPLKMSWPFHYFNIRMKFAC